MSDCDNQRKLLEAIEAQEERDAGFAEDLNKARGQKDRKWLTTLAGEVCLNVFGKILANVIAAVITGFLL